MRKQLLFLSLVGVVLSVSAGENKALNKPLTPLTTGVKVLHHFSHNPQGTQVSRSSRALVKQDIGSSGNLNSVIRSTCNQLSADDSINSVIFIHRNDQTAPCCNTAGNNWGQYRFAVSKNGGSVWQQNIGVLNPSSNELELNGRYPQAAIYRPSGVTVADSAYLGYSGTWHNGAAGIWSGEFRGAAQLSGNSATFRERADTINNGHVVINNSFTNVGEKFFNLNEEVIVGSSADYASAPTTALILEKGQWNNTTKTVDWVDMRMPMHFDVFTTGNSVFTSSAIAFDPSGKYGWLVGTGDLDSADGKFKLAPFFMKSTDYGATWTNPEQINIDTLAGFEIPFIEDQNGDTTTLRNTGGIDLVVDHLGIPHIFGIYNLSVITDDAYSAYFPSYGYRLVDLTLGSNQCQSGWIANYLKDIYATFTELNGVVDDANQAYTDNNRLQASRTMDGKHLFVIWSETDSALAVAQTAGTADNISPDLLGMGLDLITSKTTAVKNFTKGDALFSGESNGVPQGTNGGALFSSVSPIALTKGTTFNVPTILTEPDYKNPAANPKSGLNPAKYYYCENIDFAAAEFTVSNDKTPPLLDINVTSDTIIVHKDSAFIIPTATAFDCVDGVVVPLVSSNVTTSATGSYTVTYVAKDNANNTDSFVLTVLVQAKPVALIAYTKISGNKYQFRDSSLNFPTTRLWTFNNAAGTSQNPVNKVFPTSGAMNVCLKVSNTYGADTACLPLQIFVGIQDEEMTNAISLFPTTSNGMFTLSSTKAFTDNITVVAYGLNGEKLSEEKVIKASTTNSTLDFTNLASGLYQLKIGNAKDGYTVKPVIINK